MELVKIGKHGGLDFNCENIFLLLAKKDERFCLSRFQLTHRSAVFDIWQGSCWFQYWLDFVSLLFKEVFSGRFGLDRRKEWMYWSNWWHEWNWRNLCFNRWSTWNFWAGTIWLRIASVDWTMLHATTFDITGGHCYRSLVRLSPSGDRGAPHWCTLLYLLPALRKDAFWERRWEHNSQQYWKHPGVKKP